MNWITHLPQPPRWLMPLALSTLLAACASQPDPKRSEELAARTANSFTGLQVKPVDEVPPPEASEPREITSDGLPGNEGGTIFPGTGEFVRELSGTSAAPTETGEITLNFENTDIREVIKVILGDLLGQNYILDGGVRGGVTMQTSRPLAQDALLPTLETLLRMNGQGLVQIDGVYHVLPIARITKGTQVPQLADALSPLPSGYQIRIVPLQYISVEEMRGILEPLLNDSAIIRADQKRNLLLLAGTSRELQYAMDTIDTFDVDWIAGMSVGFFELKYAKVEDVQRDLETILNTQADAGLGSLLRITPIDSLNGLLVVTPRPHYMEKVASWIRRMDRIGAGDDAEPQLFVYRVRNSEATKLSSLLGELFSGEGKGKSKDTGGKVAPGQKPKTVSTDNPAADKPAEPAAPAVTSTTASDSATLEAELRIVADEDNNSLLIMATPRDYQKILRVLDKLDVVPLQVHVEATIVEVVLNDELEYGIQWYFDKNGGIDLSNRKQGNLGGDGINLDFNWSLTNSLTQIRAVINALAGKSLVNVLSAPSVMVLDNHTARIQIGDQVPIATQQQSNVGTDSNISSTVTNSIQYRDTGIVLSVKPRVNPGGLVTMEVEQEVSSVSAASASAIDSPTIATRNISSTVAVQSGEAVVLGGLIREDSNNGNAGIPVLHEMPLFGPLFGETVNNVKRTELVVILTPQVIGNNLDARRITNDFRMRLEGLKGRF